jgi:hypothetical protein
MLRCLHIGLNVPSYYCQLTTINGGTTPVISCSVLPHSLNGPLLAAARLFKWPRFAATMSASMSALCRRPVGCDAVTARTARSSG